MVAFADVSSFASWTVLNTGKFKWDCPPFLGVMPPTRFVPYFNACSEWNVPCLPVKPWHITFVSLLTNTDLYFIASTIFFAASFKSDADKIFKFDFSKISFPSL